MGSFEIVTRVTGMEAQIVNDNSLEIYLPEQVLGVLYEYVSKMRQVRVYNACWSGIAMISADLAVGVELVGTLAIHFREEIEAAEVARIAELNANAAFRELFEVDEA